MPMGKGTYGSSVGRPSKKEKREGMMKGMMPGKHRKKANMGRMMYKKGTRVQYTVGGEVMPMAKPN